MRDTVVLGRVAGVRVGAHWSLPVVVVVLGFGLARNRLPFDAPGLGNAAYDTAGAATAIGLILGVLAHEAGHAVVARRAGLGVDGITLSWMGGVTRIEGDSRTPLWEVAVAGVGPAVSAAIGGLLLVLRAAIGPGHSPTAALVASSIGWLGVINLGLALFNLIPAAPLDGGRVLHGVMWRLSGDRWRATRVTSRIGVGFGVVVVGIGLIVVSRRGDLVDAVVFTVLGYWMIGAARSEGRAGMVARALAGATVADLMRPVGAATGGSSLAEFLDTYDSVRPGWVWLLEGPDGGYSGVIAGEAARAVGHPGQLRLRALDVAVPVGRCAEATPGEDALACMGRTGGRAVVLVVDGGHTVGAVLPADVEALVASGRQAVPAGHPRAVRYR